MEVVMTYNEIGSFEMANLMGKLENTPTHNENARRIHKVTKSYRAFVAQMQKAYKTDIMEKYGKKDDKGVLIPASQDNPNGFDIIEGKEEEFKKEQEAFGSNTVTFKPDNFYGLTPAILTDVKMTAKEIELLGPLYVEENGPGVPQEGNVRHIGKK